MWNRPQRSRHERIALTAAAIVGAAAAFIPIILIFGTQNLEYTAISGFLTLLCYAIVRRWLRDYY